MLDDNNNSKTVKRRQLDEPEGVLNITLVEAKQLVNKDSRILGQGVSDPYATIDFFADKFLHRFKTFVVQDNLNPVWNYFCQVPVENIETVSDIVVKLFDKDKITNDDPLGDISIPKSVVKRASQQNKVQDFWLMLNNTKTGSVRSKVSWSTLSLTPTRQNDDQALVIVNIHSCRNIFPGKSHEPDVLVSVSINKRTKVTRKTLGNSNPIFEDRLLLLADNPTVDDVRIDVIDIKNDKLAGSVNIELTQLLNRDNLCMFDETLQLVNKGQYTSGSVRLTIGLRYLHNPDTSNVATGFHKDSCNDQIEKEFENYFGVSETPERKQQELRRDDEKNAGPIKNKKEEEKVLELKVSTNGIKENGIVAESKPLQNGKTKVKGKNLSKSSSMNGAMNGTRATANGNKPMTKDSGPRIYLTAKYNQTTSVVSLIVHKVVNLQEVSPKSIPNPYVKTYILDNLFLSHKRDVHTKKKTKTKKNTFNPVFEHTLEYFIPSNNLLYHKIEVRLLIIPGSR